MPKYCPYCGAQIKDKDKFCIVCGKPMISNTSKSKENTAPENPSENEDEKSEENKKKKEKKKSKKEDKGETKEESEIIAVQLPDEAKELYKIKMKKKILSEKLDGYLKKMKSPKYNTDFEFAEQLNLQVKAAQSLVSDIKNKEKELLSNLNDKYNMKKLTINIKKKREQLKNLTQQYKFRKIEKDVFNNLKETYKSELKVFEADRKDLLLGLKKWKTELGTEKVKLETEQKLLKGRFSAKEITDEKEFKEVYDDYSNKIKNLDLKMKIVTNAIKKPE